MFTLNSRFKDTELEFLTLYEAVMKPVATALDVLQGEEDTFMGTLLPTIVYLLECLKKEKEKLQRNGKQYMVPLVYALCTGIHKRFDEVMDDEQVITSSILIPKFKDNWSDDDLQPQKG